MLTQTMTNAGPQRSLIVDDVQSNRTLLAMILAGKGWETDEAENGREALEILRQDKNFTVIFLDLVMPEMDGVTAAATIKQDPELQHIPVIILSGTIDPQDLLRCQSTGAEGFLTKPLFPDKLFHLLSRVLDSKRQADHRMSTS